MNYNELRVKVYGTPGTWEYVAGRGYDKQRIPAIPAYYTSKDQAGEFMEDITALLSARLELDKARAVAEIVITRSDANAGQYDYAMTLLQYYYYFATGEFLA